MTAEQYTYRLVKSMLIGVAAMVLLVWASLAHAETYNGTCSWTYPYDTSDLAGFRVYRDASLVAEVADPDARQWQGQIELVDGPQEITVTAYDSAGQESVPSDPVVYDPPPLQVEGVDISVSITLEFN